MTEPYATTVAAVAPVLLLVAVLEVQHMTTRWRDRSLQVIAAYREAGERLVAAGQDAAPEQVLDMLTRLHAAVGREDETRHKTPKAYYLWTFTMIVLLVAVVQALVWLAGDSRGADPFIAWSCLLALAWGGGAIVWGSFLIVVGPAKREIAEVAAFRLLIDQHPAVRAVMQRMDE